MAAHKKPKHLQKTKMIKILVTESEFEKFKNAKNRLLNSSPALHTYDILHDCVMQIDDLALIEFLNLPHDHELKTKLRYDYMFNKGLS